jgi:2-methylcitrate dehydratase PrpD
VGHAPDSVAARLAEHVRRPMAEDMRTQPIVVAALADTLAVTVAATGEPGAGSLLDWAAATAAPGPSFAFGIARRTQASHAALVNGTLAHFLDYDDVSHAMKGHPSVVILPALLAVAEQHRLTAGEVVRAYAAGFQVAVAVAAGLGVAEHYRRGWHATGTVGVLGATAAVCKLLDLGAREIAHALGLAAAFAAGSRQSFGSHAKALQAGRAAQSAVLACELAAHGVTADPLQLEGSLGYFELLGDGCDDVALAEALAGPSALLGSGGLNVKKHPCCYHAQRAADAALALRRPGVAPARVSVTVEPGGSSALIHHDPQTGLEAKFSGEYVVAAALLDGALSLETFTTEAVRRPAVRAAMAAVTFAEADVPPSGSDSWSAGYAVVEVAWPGGEREAARVDVPRGAATNPLSAEELRAKVCACLAHGGRAEAAPSLWRRLEEFDPGIPVAALLAELAPAREPSAIANGTS